jgi:tetratricopeptide (TPR) repeat protein
MKITVPHAVGSAVLAAAILSLPAVQNANSQETPLGALQPTASFVGGEITVQGACSAFALPSPGEAIQSCQSIPMNLGSGQLNQARELANRLASLLPQNGVGPYWLGVLELRQEKYISALRHFQTAVARSPGVPMAHLILGICYAIMRQFELFKGEMVWVTEHAPNESLAYFYLGQYYSKDLDQVDKGMEFFTLALQRNPNDIRSRYLLGYAFELKGELEKARDEYQHAATAVAAQGAAYSLPLQGLARISLQEGNDDKAIEYVQKAIQTEPTLASNHALLGKLYIKKGDPSHGISALKKATDLDPADATPYYLLFRTYLKLKMPADAGWAQARFEEVKKAYGEE